MNKIPMGTLVITAGVGGILTGTMALIYLYHTNKKIAQRPYYKEAVNCIKTHPGVKHVLGHPIQIGNISVGDKNFYATETEVHLGVPVKGPKEKATMYFWAVKTPPPPEDNWKVNRIELELKSINDRRFLVMSNENS